MAINNSGECIPVVLSDGTEAVWTSTDKSHEIIGLPVGTYFLVEKLAPNGYSTAESIMFTLKSDGTLVDKSTGNKLYSLYWEGTKNSSDLDKTVGFVVKGTDSAEFLEEKLAILGLNYKEKEEFIVYWLPKLESHNYNYIYFATEEEIEKEMPLKLSVEPDTLIRVRMIFEGLNEYREVEEQVLAPTPERNGFTVVEWGGTDLTTRDN
jgi:hypothetical protein